LARFDRETNRPTLHVYDDVLPYVREQGVTRGSEITTMLVETPHRRFEHDAAS
jgi:predicted metal-dependent phosphotriesterase family hydrolase